MAKLSNEFPQVSTMDLAVFFNKLDTLVKDLNRVIMKLDALAEMPGHQNNPVLQEHRILLVKKVNETTAKANRITLEIEFRMKKKIDFACDYPMVSRIAHYVDDEYEKAFLKTEKENGQSEKASMSVVDDKK